ncbi:hypothetical protein NPIL_593751 [Nephila pilipes]|uniref:Uncharacterized protein n=1 Tax=Nephila pilipes TaxID=299642 RepID=A0A8X6TKQ6_NEPPI|nr:hypothetical protein NPIL_593751 [Nephila pilipes]
MIEVRKSVNHYTIAIQQKTTERITLSYRSNKDFSATEIDRQVPSSTTDFVSPFIPQEAIFNYFPVATSFIHLEPGQEIQSHTSNFREPHTPFRAGNLLVNIEYPSSFFWRKESFLKQEGIKDHRNSQR